MKLSVPIVLPIAIIAALAASCASTAKKAPGAPLRLAGMFSGSPILQRGAPVPVWGWGEPGREVIVGFSGAEARGVADAAGKWEAVLPAMPASAEGRALTVEYAAPGGKALKNRAAPERLIREGVIVGDVWYCSGQSNMEFGIGGADDRDIVLEDVDFPSLRIFLAPKDATPLPRADVLSGSWAPASPSSVLSGGWSGFSAVALAYGRKLYKETGVPQGLIQAAYGGSPIEAWIPVEELKSTKGLERWASQVSNAEKKWAKAKETDPEAIHPWAPINDYSKLKPGACSNALLSPVAPYAVSGVLWYQGESDVGKGPVYATEMEALIAGMRRLFRNPSMPFYFTQIAPWKYGDGLAGLSLPGLWKAQYATLSVPGTAMALTVDVGDPGDIHPRIKVPVGERLALFALRDVYGERDVDAEGPVASALRVEDGGRRIVVSFAFAEGGLRTSDGEAPRGFRAAGLGGAYSEAEATIGPMEGKNATVIVEPEKPLPEGSLRYAWLNAPEVNLLDSNGLPARPFEESFR
jgi:sialate O-acetylesterase